MYLTKPSEGAAPGASGDAVGPGFGSLGGGLAAAYEDESVDAERQVFRGRFQLIDESTGEPIAGHATRIRSTDGKYLTASTDEDGYTDWVERDANEALAFDLIGARQG